MNLLIMGPPGAGKGTQAGGIAEHYSIPTISTGQLFRDNIALGTALGKKIEALIAAGNLVSDEVTNEMVFDRLSKPDVRKSRGFLLDGYPRTLEQAEAFDGHLRAARMRLDGVVALTAEPNSLVSRMLKRAEIEGRADDTEEVIRERMAIYHRETGVRQWVWAWSAWRISFAGPVMGSAARCSWPAMRTVICWIGRSVWTIFLMLSPVADCR